MEAIRFSSRKGITDIFNFLLILPNPASNDIVIIF